MTRFWRRSLTGRVVLWTGCLAALVLAVVVLSISSSVSSHIRQYVLQDIASRNDGYVHTVHSVFAAKAAQLLSLRNDLELYETRGQMWVHIAAHAGEKVFRDPHHAKVYTESFRRKLDTYRRNGQLSDDKLTPQLRLMLDNIGTSESFFGDGMKFFYIGIAAPNPDKVLESYDEYQDSSLWVPDPSIDEPYDPLVRPWYLAGQEAGRERVVFTEPYAERRTGEALASAATAIDIKGTRGTLAAGISIKPVMDAVMSSFRRDAHLTIFSRGVGHSTPYVATEPKYIYSSRDASLGTHFKAYNAPDIIRDAAARDLMALYDATRYRTDGVQEWTIGGDARLVAYATVPDVGWKVFTSISRADAMASASSLQRRIAFISLLGITVLVAVIALTVRRALAPIAEIGREVKTLADSGDFSLRTSVTRDDEVGQMAKNINAMLDNTAGAIHELGKRVGRIAEGDLNVCIDMTGKGDIARLVQSFNYMTGRLIEFEAASRDASPLTWLPGGVSIEKAVQRRLDHGLPFAFCLFDLDNFKSFNDRYGYSRGNMVLKDVARILRDVTASAGGSEDFVGHIGGDDFVLVTTPERARRLCEAFIRAFDAAVPAFYDLEDRQAGFIASESRRGHVTRFPIMTVSVCAVLSTQNGATDYIRIGELAAELKTHAKTLTGSAFVMDQRKPRAEQL